jgi:hypothetical protein
MSNYWPGLLSRLAKSDPLLDLQLPYPIGHEVNTACADQSISFADGPCSVCTKLEWNQRQRNRERSCVQDCHHHAMRLLEAHV